ncbi:MAG: DNA topoisomerase 3 [Firmicutes bacterium]|nr:DNA topoisomerase 3 [Bacillota bacterium]
MVRLILAEKPSMGRAIASALGLQGSGRSFIQQGDTLVTWCVGHLVEALGPDGYDPALKAWRMEGLPIFPAEFRYAPIAQTQEQYSVVARLLTREDVTDVVNATDAGREGELIFDLVYRLSGCEKPVLRFWTSSLTDDAIREAYGRMKPGEAYAGLRDAARSRQESDWLVGINCTRAQTLAMRRAGGEGVYSVGRVQTPTLAILVNREQEITQFVPKDFWTLWALFATPEGLYKGKWFTKVDGKEQDRFEREDEALAKAAALSGLAGTVASVTAKTEKKRPELFYDLTALQKEANKRFGFSAEHTLEVAQGLYERKLISYPRTNSRHLTEADAAKAPGWIKAIDQGQLEELRPFVADLRSRWPVKLDKRFVDDKEVEDHSALAPTETPAQRLEGDALKVYELIARRFLAAFFPERVEAKTTLVTRIAKDSFKTTGTVVKELGWSAVDPPHARPKKESKEEGDEGEDEAGALPPVAKGQTVEVRELKPKAGKTSPPKRMTEGDLLAAMQGAGRELDDEALKGALKDCGLGTPATRASIIETLLKRGYVERKRTILQPTEKGIELIRGLKAESLTSPQLTGEWEARLERMRRGETARNDFMADVKAYVTDLVAQIKASAPARSQRVFGPVIGPCPVCQNELHLRDWEGRHYAKCSGPQCPVSFDCDAEGKAVQACLHCQGPVRITKQGGRVCVACGRWQEEEAAKPPAAPCPTCQRPMRVIPSTRRGDYFQRCAECGVTLPVATSPDAAP